MRKRLTTEEKTQILTERKSCFVCWSSFYRRRRRECICVNPFSARYDQRVEQHGTCELWAPAKKPKPKEESDATKESDGS